MTAKQPYSTKEKYGLLVAASLGFAVVQLDVSVVNVALPAIGKALSSDVSGLQWVVGAYTLTMAALLLTAGTLSDRFGAKRLFIGGFLLFTVSSAICGLAQSSQLLIAARAAQGAGASLLLPCSLALLSHAFPAAAERLRAIGIWAACASVALSGGPLVGGVLTATIGWRSIFFINLPLGLIGIVASARFAHETDPQRQKAIDLSGQCSVILCLVLLTWSIIESGKSGLHRGAVAAFGISLCLAVLFIWIERHRRAPMLNLDLFHNHLFRSMTITGFFLNTGFYGFIFVLSLFFQQVQHASTLRAGLLFAPMTVAIFAGNLAAPRISRLANARKAMLSGAMLTLGANISLLFLRIQSQTKFGIILAPLIAIGFGLGVIVPLMTSVLLESTPPWASGVAAGTLNMARQMGSVVGVSVFGAMIANGKLLPGFSRILLVYAVIMACVCMYVSRSSVKRPSR